MAAAYEQAGLWPLLWLVEGHVFLGYWRSDANRLPETVAQDAAPLDNAVDLGLIRPVETTMVTERSEPVLFSATHRPPAAAHLTGDLYSALAVIDVVTARRSGVLPLPARTRDADGTVDVTEYRPAEHSSPAVAPSASCSGRSCPARCSPRGRSKGAPGDGGSVSCTTRWASSAAASASGP